MVLYLLFPSGSSTTDAWYYAASIKFNGEIFHPHHLLYNALGYLFSYLPVKSGIDCLASLKVMNALFAALALLVIQRIIILLDKDENLVIIISSLCGLSFGIMRYATENETYIVPLFFALLATRHFLKFTISKNKKDVLYMALWITISVLFHQIYIFWWFGLLAGLISFKKRSAVINYLIVSLAGPAAYLLVIMLTLGNLQYETVSSFLLGSFKNNAHLGLSGKGLFFSAVSLIRSFIQVHGYIPDLVKTHMFFIFPAIISFALVIWSLFRIPSFNSNVRNTRFAFTIVLIIIMQFIFALLADGNAEFMVMIPVLIFILFPVFTLSSRRFLTGILIAMAAWNISYGLIPLHYSSSDPEEFLCRQSIDNHDVVIVAFNYQLLQNMIYYKTGNSNSVNIYRSPASYEDRGEDKETLQAIIDNALNERKTVYTDCIGPFPVSRASIIEGERDTDFFRKYRTSVFKSWDSFSGERSVYVINGRL